MPGTQQNDECKASAHTWTAASSGVQRAHYLGTDNVRRQLSVNIFTPNGGSAVHYIICCVKLAL